jgi:hypothetical protein
LVRARNPRIWKETKREGENKYKRGKEEKTATTSTSPGGFIFCAFLLYFVGPLDERKGKDFRVALKTKSPFEFSVMTLAHSSIFTHLLALIIIKFTK